MSEEQKIVFIGNSIINGFPYDREGDFVSIYRRRTGRVAINKGINGDTIYGMLQRFAEDVLEESPDRAVILAGTNEFIYGQQSPKRCISDVEVLRDRCMEKGILPIFLTPIPVIPLMAQAKWMVCDDTDYNEVANQVKEFRQELISWGEKNEVKVIDLYEPYRIFTELKGMTEAFVDGIHPTRMGYEFLAELLIEFLE